MVIHFSIFPQKKNDQRYSTGISPGIKPQIIHIHKFLAASRYWQKKKKTFQAAHEAAQRVTKIDYIPI